MRTRHSDAAELKSGTDDRGPPSWRLLPSGVTGQKSVAMALCPLLRSLWSIPPRASRPPLLSGAGAASRRWRSRIFQRLLIGKIQRARAPDENDPCFVADHCSAADQCSEADQCVVADPLLLMSPINGTTTDLDQSASLGPFAAVSAPVQRDQHRCQENHGCLFRWPCARSGSRGIEQPLKYSDLQGQSDPAGGQGIGRAWLHG